MKASNYLFLLILAMMSMTGLLATDIFLPAIPSMMQSLSMTSSQAQSLISLFLLGIGIMQLVYGPISDAFGRKKILLLGIGMFCLASVGIVFCHTYQQMAILRFLQAMGACVGLTLGRAIVGDLFTKEQAGKIFLTIFPFVGMSPAIAPAIGGELNRIWGWQACFLFIALFSFVLFLLILFYLDESKPVAKRTQLHPLHMLAAYQQIIKNSHFWFYTACVCFAYSAYFSYIAESAFLLPKQHISNNALGYSYISLSITYVLGNIMARKKLASSTIDSTLRLGYRLFLIGGILFALSLYLAPTVFAFSIIGISLLTFSNGFLLPLGTAGGITAIPALSGVASGVLGFLQLTSAALMAQLIGVLSGHVPFKVGLVILTIVLLGWCIFRFGYRLKANVVILKKPQDACSAE